MFPVSSKTISLSFCVQILIHHHDDAIVSVMVSYSDYVMFDRDISSVSGNNISTLFPGYNLKSKFNSIQFNSIVYSDSEDLSMQRKMNMLM